MFDPHRIGPQRTSSYSRNKGRVIQRRLVNTPSPGYTRTELEQLVPVMLKNGLLPTTPVPSPDFGLLSTYSVIVSGVDISLNYTEITPAAEGNTSIPISVSGEYMLVVPNFYVQSGSVTANVCFFTSFTASTSGTYVYRGLTPGTRLYRMGDEQGVDMIVLYGSSGASITIYTGQGRPASEGGNVSDVEKGGFAVPM